MALNDEFKSVQASLLNRELLLCLEAVVLELLTEETVPSLMIPKDHTELVSLLAIEKLNMLSRDGNRKIIYCFLPVYR